MVYSFYRDYLKLYFIDYIMTSIFIYLNFFTVPLPCIVSEWTAWSTPDATGVRFRYRYMIRPALNGGKECQDLIQLGKGLFSKKNIIEEYIFSSLFKALLLFLFLLWNLFKRNMNVLEASVNSYTKRVFDM